LAEEDEEAQDESRKKRKKRNKKKKKNVGADSISEVSVNDQSMDDRENHFMDRH
jgi:hypothetical protein